MTIKLKKISTMRIIPMIFLSVFITACGEDEVLKQENVNLTAKVTELQAALKKSQMLVLETQKKVSEAQKSVVTTQKKVDTVKTADTRSDREKELQTLLRKKNRLLALKSQQLSKAQAECESK